MIKYGCQKLSEADIAEVVKVLRSEFLTQGPAVSNFENEFSKMCGSKDSVAVNSATSGLHLAYLALGLKTGDQIWTTPNTFVATANAALMCGASVDFVDIDPKTYNLCVDKLELKLKNRKKTGRLPKIVVPVHFAGTPCDMERISHLADKYSFSIVEDASHAVGAYYESEDKERGCRPVGSGLYSDLTVFSLHPVKIITTGEGGIVTTNDPAHGETLRLLRSHGVTRDSDQFTISKPGSWHYEQVKLGYNYRMTDIQAALGLSQLTKLNEFIKMRRVLADDYYKILGNCEDITLPLQPQTGISSNHLFSIQLSAKLINSKKAIFSDLIEAGIGVNVHYRPVPEQAFYNKMSFDENDYSCAENYYQRALTLPLHPGMTREDVIFICETLKRVLKKYAQK